MISEVSVLFLSAHHVVELIRLLAHIGSVGVTTPVRTVHTWVMIRDNPALSGADFVGANIQPFFCDLGFNTG